MRAAVKLSGEGVTSSTPGTLRILTSPSDPLETFKEYLLDNSGFISMGCGCFAQVDERTMGAFDAKALAGATCAVAGTCCHQQVH
jgi:hypothetical protein